MYESLVTDECRGVDGDYASLHNDLDRWRRCLVSLIQSVDEQSALKRADVEEVRRNGGLVDDYGDFLSLEIGEFIKDVRRWQSKSAGFKRHMVVRLGEVKAMIKAKNIEQSGVENKARDVVAKARQVTEEYEREGSIEELAVLVGEYDEVLKAATGR